MNETDSQLVRSYADSSRLRGYIGLSIFVLIATLAAAFIVSRSAVAFHFYETGLRRDAILLMVVREYRLQLPPYAAVMCSYL